MNKLSDEEKNIKKAMEEFEIPFSTASWEKAEILLDKQVKTKWLFKSLIAISILAVFSVSLYLFSSGKTPVSDNKLMVENTHGNLQTKDDKKELVSQNPLDNPSEILKENNLTENKNHQGNASLSSKKTNQTYQEANIDKIKKYPVKNLYFSSKKEELNIISENKNQTGFIKKTENSFVTKTQPSESTDKNPFQNLPKENTDTDENNFEGNKAPLITKNETTNPTENPWNNNTSIAENNIETQKGADTIPKENLTSKSPEKIAQKDTAVQQNKVIIPEPIQKYDKRFIVGISGGITAYKTIDKQKTSTLNYTPVLGVFIQKSIKEKLGVKMAFSYNQVELNNISKTYEGTTYGFGKNIETITVSPTKLHLLHSNIALVYQYRPQLNFQLGATYIYALNATNNFEENKINSQRNYQGNSKFFNGYQAIPAIQFGTEYQNKKGFRYGIYLQQGIKNLVNEKQFGTVQSKTLFNLNLYLAYDLSRF